MKKYILLVIVVCSLAACSADSQRKIVGAVGIMGLSSCIAMGGKHCGDKKFDDYVRENGVPTSSYKMNNGDTLYSFVKSCPSGIGQEERTLTVDKEGWITQEQTMRACPTNANK